MSYSEEHRYDDIINLPHHVSVNHPHMPLADRAAQFSPFAALTGHGDAIKETARLTDVRTELDENSKTALDMQLQLIREHFAQKPEITFTYFKPDARKSGGSYETISGTIKKMDEYERRIVLDGGASIAIDEIVAMESDLFNTIYE